MHFNILPGQHVIVTSRHPNPKFPPSTSAALVVFVEEDRIAFYHPNCYKGLATISRSGNEWISNMGIPLKLTDADGKDLLASGFVRE